MAALLVASCAGPEVTEIVVETGTDFVPGTELARVEWELRSNLEEPFLPRPTAELPEGFTDLPLTLTVTPETVLDAPLEVIARGYRPDGSLLIEQRRQTEFVPGASLVLRMELTRRCEGQTCDAAETCETVDDEARCTPVDIDPSLVPPHRPGRPSGSDELCNGRDDDGDGPTDEGFDLASDPEHCGACHRACPTIDNGNGAAVCVDESCGFACDLRWGDCDGDPSLGS